MNAYEQLDLGIKVAVDAHCLTFDKGGKPYILHPLHLMNQLMFDPELACIAVMHDVIEDSDFTLGILEGMGFSPRVLMALDLLTHFEGESYEDYIDGMRNNIDAIRVKRKDLQHNSDITRLKDLTAKSEARIVKYHKAFTKLGEFKRRFEEV